MERQEAQFLLPFVNKIDNMDSLKFYAAHRITSLHKELEGADLSTVTCIQGQIKELRKLLELDVMVKHKAI